MNQYKKIIIIICFVNILILGFTDKINAKENYTESEQIVNINITTDAESYSDNEKMSITVSLDNYNDQFTGDITTMIIELVYDSDVVKPEIETVKKIAKKTGSMGFSHIDVNKNGNVKYQYVDVEEHLKKGSTDLFSLVFDVKESIDTLERIKGVIKTGKIVIQDGSVTPSVRYISNVEYFTDLSAGVIASDDAVGLREYNSDGDLLSDDEQITIQQNALNEKETYESDSISSIEDITESVSDNKSENQEKVNLLADKNSKNKIVSITTFVIAVMVAVVIAVVCVLIYKRKGW